MVIHYEANRYFVQIGGGMYLVDLDEFASGYCSCRDFECRHLSRLTRIEEEGNTTFPKAECKHITYLRKHLRAKTQQATEDHIKEEEIGQQA